MLWPWLSRLGLSRLPGDIMIERGEFGFYSPIVTCLVVSGIVSLILWLPSRCPWKGRDRVTHQSSTGAR